jgi:hypothetical protein
VEYLVPPAPDPGVASSQRAVDYEELDAAGLADRPITSDNPSPSPSHFRPMGSHRGWDFRVEI